MVYELTCNGCNSIYVGQTCRHITTRVAEHAKADSPVGLHAIECNGDKTAFQWKILDQCGNQSKLMTMKECQISINDELLQNFLMIPTYDQKYWNIFSLPIREGGLNMLKTEYSVNNMKNQFSCQSTFLSVTEVELKQQKIIKELKEKELDVK